MSHRSDQGGSRTAQSPRSTQLQTLIEALLRKGYEVIGPTVRDGAIVFDRIESAAQLPAGWTDEQEAGRYGLKPRQDQALFGYAVGPQSWKNYLHPADVRLWSAERQGGTFRILNNETRPKRRYAFLGVRACDLAAIAVQDRVLLGDKYQDPIYQERREGVFVVAVQCNQAASTCFCASMGTGPRARAGFDLALTELIGQGGHRFVAEVGSDRGREVLAELGTVPAGEAELQHADTAVNAAASQQVRSIDTAGIKELLYQNFDHPRWDNVASRCLTCANCTMVCPTCFCTTVEDVTDVSGDHAERWRRWDSCFTLNIHGGSVRTSTKARYRQWMTHKLASWIDQFGTSGCVGCGRCIPGARWELTSLRKSGPYGRKAIMETLERIIAEHPFFAGLESYYFGLLVGCASNTRFAAGSYIFKEGGEANEFYLIRAGKVALEVFAPQHKPIIISTLGEGEILGWSWLLPPYQWRFHAHAVEDTRAIALDGKCLRNKCEQNHDLGYELLKRFSQIVDRRLEATLLQLVDVYAVR